MRNLKRVLSLALACVMVIGMMVMTTGAADFDDAAEIKYVEAVDVMSALGILEGDDLGNFNPTSILTREQAAKIICYMLMGPANAEMLNGSAAFSDVEADRWSAPFISYCSSLGIIAGMGDGTFNPTGELTGVAFAKLLLVALGYDAEVEGYVNNKNWATNIGTDAIDAGINIAGISLDAALTREQAAQMALNAICTPLVEYETKGTSISVNGAEVAFGGSKADYVTTTLAKEQRISTQTLTNSTLYTVEFGEKYFPNLTVFATEDAMARPAREWLLKNDSIGLYAFEPDYAGYIAGKNFNIEKLVDSFSKRFNEAAADVYVNGLDTDEALLNAEKLGNYVEIYMDNDDATLVDRICITHKTVTKVLGKVSTTEVEDTTYVNVPSVTDGAVESYMITGWQNVKPMSVVMYYVDNAGAYHINNPESFNGTMTASADEEGKDSHEEPSNFTISKKIYELSEQTNTIGADELVLLKQDTTATYWLDDAGYIIWGEGEEDPIELMLVLKNNDYTEGNVFKGNTLESQVLFVDETGATKIVNISKIGTDNADTTHAPAQLDSTNTVGPNAADIEDDDTTDGVDESTWAEKFIDNCNKENTTLYSYALVQGKYQLTEVDALARGTGAIAIDEETKIIKGIPSAFATADGYAYSDMVSVTDSKTIYLVRDEGKFADAPYADTYTVYTGFANVPSMTIAADGAVAYAERGVAKYVVINDYTLVGSAAEEAVYVLDNEITAHYDAQKKNVEYFTVSAIVDGVKTTIKIAAENAYVEDADGNVDEVLKDLEASIKDHTLYVIESYDEDGYVDYMAEAVSSTSAEGTYYWVGIEANEAASNDKIVLGGGDNSSLTATSFAYAKDCVVYTISARGDIVTKGDIDTLGEDDNDKISVVVAGDIYGTAPNNTVVEIYVYKQNATTTGEASSEVTALAVKDDVTAVTIADSTLTVTTTAAGTNGDITVAQLLSVLETVGEASKKDVLTVTLTDWTGSAVSVKDTDTVVAGMEVTYKAYDADTKDYTDITYTVAVDDGT